jgi:hypothetical protein
MNTDDHFRTHHSVNGLIFSHVWSFGFCQLPVLQQDCVKLDCFITSRAHRVHQEPMESHDLDDRHDDCGFLIFLIGF